MTYELRLLMDTRSERFYINVHDPETGKLLLEEAGRSKDPVIAIQNAAALLINPPADVERVLEKR